MDSISVVKYGIFGTKTLLNVILNSPDVKKQILDPLSCVIRLSLLTFKERGTKIRIANNKIYFQDPNIFQGPVRWTYGDNRNDLHNLCNPIEKAIEWFNPLENENIYHIFLYAIEGLSKLKQAYIEKNVKVGDSNLVCHSISHYITLLQNRLQNFENEISKGNYYPENAILKDLWKEKEIQIVDNLLTLAIDKKNNGEEYFYLINAIESILEDKDERVYKIVTRISTSL